MEFSVSFNLGLTIGPDLIPRSRPIELAFYEEDPNARTFSDPHLHRTLKKTRAKILSAIAAIFKVWAKAGFPDGPTPFASFVEWAETIGGVMLANRTQMYAAFDPIAADGEERSKKAPTPPEGWGDPCRPWTGNFAESTIDRRTAAMAALFVACEAEFGDKEVRNKSIIACVATCQKAMDTGEEDAPADDGDESTASPLSDAQINALEYFGRLEGEDSHKNKIRLMSAVRTFNGRILSGIKLIIRPNDSRAIRDLYKFARQHPEDPKTPPHQTQMVPKTTANDAKQYKSDETHKILRIVHRNAEIQLKEPSEVGSVGTVLDLFPIMAYTRAR